MLTLEELNAKIVQQTKVEHRLRGQEGYDTALSELNAMKFLKNALINQEKDGKVINEELIIQTLLKMIKQREDSIVMYEKNGRQKNAQIERDEMEYYKSLLPNVDEREVENYVISIAEKIENISMKDMKNVMSEVKAKYPTADGKLISASFKMYMVKDGRDKE